MNLKDFLKDHYDDLFDLERDLESFFIVLHNSNMKLYEIKLIENVPQCSMVDGSFTLFMSLPKSVLSMLNTIQLEINKGLFDEWLMEELTYENNG